MNKQTDRLTNISTTFAEPGYRRTHMTESIRRWKQATITICTADEAISCIVPHGVRVYRGSAESAETVRDAQRRHSMEVWEFTFYQQKQISRSEDSFM